MADLHLTTLGDDSGVFGDNRQSRSLEDLFEYLSENPRHAILYHVEEDAFRRPALDGTVLASFFIARDAGEKTFYYGPHPIEEPDDVWEEGCGINDLFDLEDIFVAIEENL